MIADGFCNGDTTIAGLIMFICVLALIFVLTRNVFHSLLLGLPVIFIFTAFGVLSTDMTVLLVIIAVLGLAMTARDATDGRRKRA